MMKTASIAGALAMVLATSAPPAASANPLTGLFAQGAATANTFELEEAKIILEDSTNPVLRVFAQHMIEDHGVAQQALESAGRRARVTTSFILDGVRQRKVDDLGLMDGAKLDAAYLADQVEAHAAAAASLQAYAAHGSNAALAAYARATLPAVRGHQRMLERITGQPKPM